MEDELLLLSGQVRRRLQSLEMRVVFAESCTAGNVAASLAVWPGISDHLCGSFVVYRCDSKARWLGIPDDLLASPEVGPVSAKVTELLAIAALARTEEADLAVAVTGDLGPNAPAKTDGRIFCASLLRSQSVPNGALYILRRSAPLTPQDVHARQLRLMEATQYVLQFTLERLAAPIQ